MDSLYRVILSLESQGNLGTNVGHLTQKLHEAHGGVSHLREGLSSMGEALERVADRAFEVTKHIAEIGLGAGLAAAAYGVAHLNRSLEETNLSLATVFQTQGFASNFNDALKLSQEQLGKMKQDVKSLPGDLGQLSDIMKMIATPAAQGGANADQIRALAGRGMLVSRILGVPQEVAARELAQLFAGRAGSHNILGGRMGLIGEHAKAFNAESAQDRVKEITKLFNTPAMNSAAEAFSHTWTAQITTLADNTKYLMLAPATSGLFERVKNAIGEVNSYIDAHKQKIEEVASLVNRRLVSAWDELESIVKRLAPIIGPMLDKFVHLQPAELGKYAERAGETMLGMKIGGMALQGAGSALGMMGRFGMMGGGGAMAGIGAVAAEALPALGAAAVVAAPALVAAAGAFDILTDKNSTYHDEAVNTAEDIGQVWGRVGENLQRALLPAEHASERVADKMGILALEGLDKAAIYAERVTVMLVDLSNGFQHFADVIKYGLGSLEALKKFRETQPEETAPVELAHDIGLHLIRMAPHEGPGAGKSGAKTGAGGGGGGTNIQKVEIVVKGNDDPSRVARLTVKELEKFARNPRQSRYVPEYSRP